MPNSHSKRRISTKDEEILKILKEINEEFGNPLDNDLLQQIVSLVMMNPLEEDRQRCQDQILEIINQRVR